MVFTWGENGAQMTPEAIAAQRKVAQAMMQQAADYSPVKSGWQGAARLAQGLVGGWESGQADVADKANRKMEADLFASGAAPMGLAPPTAAPVAPTAAPASVATPMGATSIPAGNEAFVSKMMPLAEAASAKTGIDPRIIVAQAALESGYGKSAPGNNYFGIKSHGAPGGNVLPTTEVVNGQPVRTASSFAAYASPEDSANGYANFINSNPRYAGLKSATGLDAQVAALGSSGYATDPAYASKIGSIARGLPVSPAQVVDANAPSPMDTAQWPAGPVGAPGTQSAQQPSQPAAAPVQQVAQSMPDMRKLMQAYPYLSESGQKIAGIMMQQQMKPQEYTYQTTPDGTILRMDPRGGAPQPVYTAATKPQFTKVGTDPNTGADVMGFVDANGRKVEEYKPPGAAAQPSALPPVPAGVDPKVWREGQSKAALANNLPATFDDTTKLRHEFTQLPAYKNMAQAAPVYQAMREAAGRDTKAADLNIVYGLGKIMDPGSVVREGEIAMANNAQGWQEKLNGIIGQINSKGGLTPEGRQALMAEAHGRIQAYKSEFDRDAGRYKGIATRNRISADDVIPDFGTVEPWMAPKVAPAAPVEIDGYKIKAR